ncbi:hypothetical protein CSUB01_05516 [Colletotrichum sublineola]|uniref:Uncharacterized protein n=1 Tax=Colletotrichum sublineola TaxID=1173701 RepID=A0A066XHG3_COLSU|nr:hypothetical protein CSUB01_05516 [Colletotrichum sublineola]
MKTFATALLAFGTAALAADAQITVSCAGIGNPNVNPCDVVSGGKYDVSSALRDLAILYPKMNKKAGASYKAPRVVYTP